jgi:hypothetical protein
MLEFSPRIHSNYRRQFGPTVTSGLNNLNVYMDLWFKYLLGILTLTNARRSRFSGTSFVLGGLSSPVMSQTVKVCY